MRRHRRGDRTEIACTAADGELEGPWALLDGEGRVEMSGTHRDGLRHGEFVGYTDGTRTLLVDHCAGLRHGRLTRWSATSGHLREEGSYIDNEQHGEWRTWHDNGQLARIEHYRGGLAHGEFEQWDATGRSLGRFIVENGTGPWRDWHDNGAIMREGQLRDGKQVGRWVIRTDDGRVVSEQDHGE